MGDDVERVVVGYERAKVQTRHVLYTTFITYARGQFLVGPDAVTQVFHFLQELGVALPELLTALFVAGVQDGAVGQYDACRNHHAVAVGMYATVHARGIIDDDAAHHGRPDGGRVRREDASVRLQNLVYTGADDARLQADGVLMLSELIFLPVLASYNEHAVGTALPAQRRAGSPESEWQLVLLAGFDNLGNPFLTVAAYDNLWNLAIETGIGTPAKGAQFVGVNAFRRNELSEFC